MTPPSGVWLPTDLPRACPLSVSFPVSFSHFLCPAAPFSVSVPDLKLDRSSRREFDDDEDRFQGLFRGAFWVQPSLCCFDIVGYTCICFCIDDIVEESQKVLPQMYLLIAHFFLSFSFHFFMRECSVYLSIERWRSILLDGAFWHAISRHYPPPSLSLHPATHCHADFFLQVRITFQSLHIISSFHVRQHNLDRIQW